MAAFKLPPFAGNEIKYQQLSRYLVALQNGSTVEEALRSVGFISPPNVPAEEARRKVLEETQRKEQEREKERRAAEAQTEAERKAREVEANRKAKEDADRKAREEEESNKRADATRKEEEAIRKAAEAKQRENEERKAREEEAAKETARKAREEEAARKVQELKTYNGPFKSLFPIDDKAILDAISKLRETRPTLEGAQLQAAVFALVAPRGENQRKALAFSQ